MFQSLRQDVLYGVRSFLKVPGLSAAIVVSIGLGIAANATVFSMVNALLLREAPVREPDRAVALARGNSSTFSYPDYRDFRDQSRDVFEGLAAHFPFVPANLNAGGAPQRIWGQLVSGNYFSLLGIQPFLGRGILPHDDEARGKSPVVVLSHSLWQRLGRDPGAGGQHHRLERNGVYGGRRGAARVPWHRPSGHAGLLGAARHVRPAFAGSRRRWRESRRALAGVVRPPQARRQPRTGAAAVNVINARINAEHEKSKKLVPMNTCRRSGRFPKSTTPSCC